MGRSFAVAFACLGLLSAALVVSVSAPPATATDQSPFKPKPPRGNSPEQIKKCDDEESGCKAGCDKNIIDIDNQIDLCKKGCERERALCLPFRRAPGTGTTGIKPKSPPPATRN